MFYIKKKILFLLLMVVSILNMISVKAETCNPDKISIESISTLEKNDNTEEVEEATIEGKKIKLNLSVSEVGDNIKYKLVVKNDSNEDYKLNKDNFNIESDYINYTFETEDNSNIVKANNSKIIYLRVEYKKEIPSEILDNNSYSENKKISLNVLDNEITNPETKRNIIIVLLIALLVVLLISISVKNKKYLKFMILIIGITLPIMTSALCEANIEIDLQLKIVPSCVPFNDESSWEGIINSIKNNNTECMNVGDMKTIDMGTLGTHTIRIANKSTPSECSTEGFSETACGFVVEFSDVITTHIMNPNSQGASVNGDGNKGDWEYSELRNYLNTTIYNSLPSELKTKIVDTKVISSYGLNGTENFNTIDKIYLLSTKEIWEDVDENITTGIDYYDTTYSSTRQLDYYRNLGVTTSNYSGAYKHKNTSNGLWWLRSSYLSYNNCFYIALDNGAWSSARSNNNYGVSPAFRIG